MSGNVLHIRAELKKEEKKDEKEKGGFSASRQSDEIDTVWRCSVNRASRRGGFSKPVPNSSRSAGTSTAW